MQLRQFPKGLLEASDCDRHGVPIFKRELKAYGIISLLLGYHTSIVRFSAALIAPKSSERFVSELSFS